MRVYCVLEPGPMVPESLMLEPEFMVVVVKVSAPFSPTSGELVGTLIGTWT